MKKRRRLLQEIRFQMVLIFGVMTTVLAVLLMSVAIYNLNEWARDEAITEGTSRAGQFSIRAHILLDEVEKVIQWGQGENCYQFVVVHGDKQKEGMALIRDMRTYRISSLIDSSIYNVYIFDIDGRSYDERKGVYELARYPKSARICEAVRGQSNKLLSVLNDEGERVLVYGAPIRQPGTGKPIGYVAVEFRQEYISRFLREESQFLLETYAIADPELGFIAGDETLLYEVPEDQKAWLMGEGDAWQTYRVGRRERLLIRNEIFGTSWKLICAAYMDELTPQTGRIIRAIIMIGLLTVAAGVFAYMTVMNRMMSPITRMRERMREAAGGNLDATVEEASGSEFSMLERQYNRMLARIKSLIEQNREDQKALQKAELSALQAQIAPHFLYNTLDTIIWLVAVNENEKAMEMIENLSVFFKTGLSKGMDWISVATEIDHVRSYLFIQQSRYSDMLTYTVQVPESMQHYDMLKMILQPIVENAIYHGIKNKEGGGRIEIHGWEDEAFLCFSVKDTGVGMEEDQVRALNSRMEKNDQGFQETESGFGLYNVNRRIRLYYGEGCGLSVRSALDEGTEVLIRVLRQEGKRGEGD